MNNMGVKECRICLADTYRGLDPVRFARDGGEWLSPCRCKGTSRWVHRGCLEEWIEKHALTHQQKTECSTCR